MEVLKEEIRFEENEHGKKYIFCHFEYPCKGRHID